MNEWDHLPRLSDEQMRMYLADGFLVLQSRLPQEVHGHIRDRCEEIFSTMGNPGNEILEMNPALRLVFADPLVKGALSSILGHGFFMHPHRHCHQNRSGTPAQANHKDSYEEDVNVHHHRSRWAMAMYYPQDVTADMGPTGVTPGSQYFSSPESLAGHKELGVTGEAGTVILVHYDIWHRALRNHSGRNRYMLKFLFCRAAEPAAPPGTIGKRHGNRPQVGSRTHWNPCGGPCGTGTGENPFRQRNGNAGMPPCRICWPVQRRRD